MNSTITKKYGKRKVSSYSARTKQSGLSTVLFARTKFRSSEPRRSIKNSRAPIGLQSANVSGVISRARAATGARMVCSVVRSA